MDETQEACYLDFEEEMKTQLREALARGDNSLLGLT